MNRVMWANPATQANVALLQARGIAMLGPRRRPGLRRIGAGRMLEPLQIVAALRAFAPTGPLPAGTCW
jgi:phosphopantothenoylcysteine decarboxylase/phosphopantothenate--cysteine ligase